jgi:hypothetical protein
MEWYNPGRRGVGWETTRFSKFYAPRFKSEQDQYLAYPSLPEWNRVNACGRSQSIQSPNHCRNHSLLFQKRPTFL